MTGDIALPRPLRRLLALLLLAFLPALAALAVVAPVLSAADGSAARQAQALLLEQRAGAIAARVPALQAEVSGLRAALAGVVALPGGGTHALAGAELQRHLRQAAGRHGGAVLSIETLPEAHTAEGVVAVRARLHASAAGLRDLLGELEAGAGPLLEVQSLTLAPRVAQRGQGMLDVQLQLQGLRREPVREGSSVR
jgi:hypothetical protein